MQNEDSLYLPCTCGAFEIAEFTPLPDDWGEDNELCISITVYARTWRDKIKGIWKVLKGSPYGITDEIIVSRTGARELVKWLTDRLEYGGRE